MKKTLALVLAILMALSLLSACSKAPADTTNSSTTEATKPADTKPADTTPAATEPAATKPEKTGVSTGFQQFSKITAWL